MKQLVKPNIFTLTVIVLAFAFAFRLVHVASAVVEEVKDEPPPITKADVEKSVQQAETALDKTGGTEDGAAAGGAGASPVVQSGGTAEPAPEPSFSSSEIEVLQSLAKRRDELDKREADLAQREALFKAAEQQVDRKIAELNKLKADMETLLGQQQKEQESQLQSLVKMYENMKPKDAARIFDSLQMGILLDIIDRMNERKASPILASMNPEKAKDVTIRLAEQRKLPGGDAQPAKDASASTPPSAAPAQ